MKNIIRRAGTPSLIFIALTLTAICGRAGTLAPLRVEEQAVPWLKLHEANKSSLTGGEQSGRGLALASADFDEDGVPDLVSSYGDTLAGALIIVRRGNVDAIYPNSPEAKARRERGEFTDAAFLGELNRITLPEPADLIGTGDFDADGHWDIVATRQGGDKLYWLRGDGKGGFAAPKIIYLPGTVTSMVTGEMNRADGLTDVAVSVVTSDGPRVLVFESPNGALRGEPESFVLPAPASALALGQLDDDSAADLAIATGNEVMIVHGRDRKLSLDAEQRATVKAAEVSRTALESAAVSIAVGDFTGDAKQELAVLTADGNVRVLERGGASGKEFLANKAMTLNVATSGPDGGTPHRLLATKVSSLPKDDLLVFGGTKAVSIVTPGRTPALGQPNLTSAGSDRMSIAASPSSDSDVTAALPMRLNASALKDLVLLDKSGSAPFVAVNAPAATFVVNITGSTDDKNPGDGICADTNGNCSYNAALQESNAHPGADTITFNIPVPGGGVPRIDIGNVSITDAVTIDGTTQPGGRVEIISSASFAVQLFADNCVVRGLAAYQERQVPVFFVGSSGNIIEGNYIGLKGDGTLGHPVGVTGIGFFANSPANNLIGGTTAAARNIISGCETGIFFNVAGPGNIIRGNYFGTNPSGTAGIANNTAIYLNALADYTVGGTTAGAGNLISGNGSRGGEALYIQQTGALIQGNRFGTTADGTQPIANGGYAINVNGDQAVTIGGTTPAARNLISASSIGIRIGYTAGTNSLIQGNFIGTNAAGTGALPNLGDGVWLQGAPSITIGGTAAGAGNIISGNGGYGIVIGGGINNVPSQAAITQGNLVGTDVNGVVAIPNTAGGVYLAAGRGTLIGGTTAEARNVISGNSKQGIILSGGDASDPNRIEGNYIGVNRFGTGALGNAKHGIFYIGNTTGHNIGGLAPGAGNRIAFNRGAGIASESGRALGGAILSNSIFSNAGLGIDRGEDGVSLVAGGASFDNPVLTSVTTSGSETTITGRLRTYNIGTGQTPFTIQFFSNTNPDPSGYGEGQVFIGQTTVTAGSFATVSFTATITPAAPPGRFISAVAVGSPDINFPTLGLFSSEFSFCTRVAGVATPENTPLRINFITPMLGGDNGSATATIIGEGIRQGATVVLRRAGQPDIIGENFVVSADGSSMSARFNLRGRELGSWDVVVTNANGATTVFAGGYTVEAGRGAQLWTDLLGRPVIRVNRVERFTIVFGNRGNTDAYMVPIWIAGIPKNAKVTLGFTLGKVPIPNVPNAVDPNQIAPVIATATEQMLPVIIPMIRPGGVGTLQFTIEVPSPNNNAAPDFTLRAWSAPALVKSITQTGVSNRYGSAGALTSSDNIVTNDDGNDCMDAVFEAAASCALNIIPGSKCVKSFAQYTANTLTLNQGGDDALGWSQFSGGALQLFLSCAGSVTPGLNNLLSLVSCGGSFYSAYNTCRDGNEKKYPVKPVASRDPNDKVGSVGIGAPRFITGADPFRYSIYFENVETATAAAQEVVITDQLDVAKLDLATFELGAISFGKSTVVTPSPGLSEWTTDVDLRPAQNLVVRIVAALEKTSGVVTWHFISLDPATRQPTDDPLAGFLPPDKNSPEGDGVVVFSVKPKTGQPDGTQIQNKARIVFDANAPIDTPTWSNTIDNSAPISNVLPLAANQDSTHFQVSWTGTDTGSGITSYTIYVSENGGPFTVWLDNTPLTSAFYDGRPNATLSFYSVAHDGAGNNEAPPASPDATSIVPSGQLLNIATRMRVQTGDNVLIGGLIVTGTDSKKVIIRGLGPSLAPFGITDALGDPTLELYQGSTLLQSNDNWKLDQRAEIEATGLAPTNDLESAIVRTLAPGNYTAILRGNNNLTGIGLVEVYDIDQGANSKLGNIATRGFVDTNDNIMIGGVIVGGHNNSGGRVLVRALGPSLTAVGVPGALLDPTLELHDANGLLLTSNDNWKDSPQQLEIQAANLAPTDDRESAILRTLTAGNYTAIVRGKDNTTGVALVEVYNLP